MDSGDSETAVSFISISLVCAWWVFYHCINTIWLREQRLAALSVLWRSFPIDRVNLLPVRNPSRRWCLAGWWQDGIARLGRVPRLGFLGWIAVLILNNRRSRAEFPRPWLRVSLSAVILLDLTLTQKL